MRRAPLLSPAAPRLLPAQEPQRLTSAVPCAQERVDRPDPRSTRSPATKQNSRCAHERSSWHARCQQRLGRRCATRPHLLCSHAHAVLAELPSRWRARPGGPQRHHTRRHHTRGRHPHRRPARPRLVRRHLARRHLNRRHLNRRHLESSGGTPMHARCLGALGALLCALH